MQHKTQPHRHSSACSRKNEANTLFFEAPSPRMMANSIRRPFIMSHEIRKPISPTITNRAGNRMRLNVM